MLCSEKTSVNIREGSSDIQGSISIPSSISDKENVVPDESQASSSHEQHVDNSPSSLNRPYSSKSAAKKSRKENSFSCNQGKKNVSPESGADGGQSPRLKHAKTDSAIRVRSTDHKNVEGEVSREAFPSKKLLEQFRYLYLKGLYNMWLECANRQNHGSSNASKNENADSQGPVFWGMDEFHS
ncbi:unnamed protein product [Cylicocyclus nassatus]|uniref:Uncharacterized protein n=1 Tax=Cylicocyclus nassatus TaxID=53992 RepID=A0AA36GYB3_CYLNA|nr:unnamed protein product [Cylicocyclus nassatus]